MDELISKLTSELLLSSLWENEIGAKGAKALADALKVNSTLTKIK